MEWFLSGSTNINDAHPSVHPWWKPWADDKGEVKNSYGKQFRHYGDSNFDQIDYLLRSIAKDPYSRSNIITTWNPKEMEEAPISNCHGSLIKFWAEMDGKLNLTMVQRSCDMIVGVPHNWIQYYALLLWISETLRLPTGRMEWIGLDCHIYSEHLDIAEKIKSSIYGNHFLSEGPKLVRVGNSTDFEADNFKLSGYALNPIVTDKPSLIV
jgi:thymidylate synthase